MTSHITRLQRRGKAGLTVQKAIATARQLVCAHNRLARALCAPGGRITGRGSRGEHLRARQSARGTVGCWRKVTSQTRKVFATLPQKQHRLHETKETFQYFKAMSTSARRFLPR